MVFDSILPHAESGPNDHRKDAPRLYCCRLRTQIGQQPLLDRQFLQIDNL